MSTVQKKKIDNRIRVLLENGIKQNHRSLFVIVGDKGKDQVVNLHYMLSKAIVKARPSVLWCYKKELGFSTHRKKRMKQLKKQISRGVYDPNRDDPFELFITSTNIRWCYYKESHKILGNTYGMLVLQDFEAITPNILARTVETVEGGGIVILLLKTMTSLKQLYTLSMDVHSRYRTESHQDVVSRFNERFLLSLTNCSQSLLMDDELNILPISLASRTISALPPRPEGELTKAEQELKDLKASLRDTEPIGSIIDKARTLDQAKAVLTFYEAISEKSLRSTVALTASRGRGKSAALGLAIAAAVAFGYSNIFVTSPNPENLKTLFDFIFKGFDGLEYKEHLDYEIVQSTNQEFNNCIVRVNVFKTHRQTIQYINPADHQKLGQAELVVIDEAAAIPLPIVKNLLGPYLVFMASTINGYEGTGRSLSLKLIKQLREQSGTSQGNAALGGRTLREIQLQEPIRYGQDDVVEKWLNELLCLDATVAKPIDSGCPHPDQCELFYVNRDTLFSYHKLSEKFLQRMMALYVSSHYKNSPNDLMLMSDAPAHHLFVLLPPINEETKALPEILCVIQVCLEGEISRESVAAQVGRGQRASGDLIPWTVSQQFQDDDFPSLSGARVVRIATHPEYHRMGYGRRALQILQSYYEGKITNLSEVKSATKEESIHVEDPAPSSSVLLQETLKPRKNLPPLFSKLSERAPEKLHYLGVSYGLTKDLFGFWQRAQYIPVYIRLTQNELTGEHTCIMLKELRPEYQLDTVANPKWLESFAEDFRRRYMSLLGYELKEFSCETAYLIFASIKLSSSFNKPLDSREALNDLFTAHDMKRLEGYAHNLLDYHVIIDLLPTLSRIYFSDRLASRNVKLAPSQEAILLGLGLQHKNIDQLARELSLEPNQVMAFFNKVVRKLSKVFREMEEADEAKELPEAYRAKDVEMHPVENTLEDDLTAAGNKASDQLNKKHKDLLQNLSLPDYAIVGDENAWRESTAAISKGKIPNIVSVKKLKRKLGDEDGPLAFSKQNDEDETERKMKKIKKKKLRN